MLGAEVFKELQAMNPVWNSAPSESDMRRAHLPLARIEQIYRVLSYVDRWTGQLQERIVQLAL